MSRREKTLSIRALWPFVRLVGRNSESAARSRAAGVNAALFTDPDARLPHGFVMSLLERTIEITADPALGLHAAALMDPGDVDVLEYAARGCPNLEEGLRVLARYFHLMDESIELSLRAAGDKVAMVYRSLDGYVHPNAAADYAIAGLFHFVRRNAVVDPTGMEAWFAYVEPPHSEEHRRLFGIPVRFGARWHALVMPRPVLAAPMRHAAPNVARAFQRRAEHLVGQLKQKQGVVGRVREIIAAHLGSEPVAMNWAARRLGMSVATLRRHLAQEGATFSEVVNDVRRGIAERELQEGSTSISEVAFMLGFSNVAAFHRAFKRWTGMSPTDYRARHQASQPADGISDTTPGA